MKKFSWALIASALVLMVTALPSGAAAGSAEKIKIGKAEDYNPVIDPADFADGLGPLPIDNEYFPLVPGTTFYYEAETPDGLETDEVFVTYEMVNILGVDCVVVHDTVALDGSLIEDTDDWYAQDAEGNVWYFGEYSEQWENGVLIGTEGSWTAGVDGAKPGIIMLADPKPGDAYRQEYAADVAEDMARVMRLNAGASVPYDDYEACLETKEWSPIEPGAVEQKFYAPGIGNVLVIEHHGKAARQELVDITFP